MGVHSERTMHWRVVDETESSYGSAVTAIFDDDGDCVLVDDQCGSVRVTRFVCAELARVMLAEMKKRRLDE